MIIAQGRRGGKSNIYASMAAWLVACGNKKGTARPFRARQIFSKKCEYACMNEHF